jgi:hypothetical protein
MKFILKLLYVINYIILYLIFYFILILQVLSVYVCHSYNMPPDGS